MTDVVDLDVLSAELRALRSENATLRADRDGWRQEHENALACWKADNAALLARSSVVAESDRQKRDAEWRKDLDDILGRCAAYGIVGVDVIAALAEKGPTP